MGESRGLEVLDVENIDNRVAALSSFLGRICKLSLATTGGPWSSETAITIVCCTRTINRVSRRFSCNTLGAKRLHFFFLVRVRNGAVFLGSVSDDKKYV